MPVLSSSSWSGPGEPSRDSGHQKYPAQRSHFLTDFALVLRQVICTGVKGKQRQAADHSGEGCPGGGSDGYMPLWGQWSTGLADGCPEIEQKLRLLEACLWGCRNGALLCSSSKILKTNPSHLGKWSITWKSPSPHTFLIEAFVTFCKKKEKQSKSLWITKTLFLQGRSSRRINHIY